MNVDVASATGGDKYTAEDLVAWIDARVWCLVDVSPRCCGAEYRVRLVPYRWGDVVTIDGDTEMEALEAAVLFVEDFGLTPEMIRQRRALTEPSAARS